MREFFKVVLLTFIVFFSSSNTVFANSNNSSTVKDEYNWDKVMNAIIEVESNGNSKAKRGNSVGAMQITPVLVFECNQILRKRRSKRKFKLSDRWSVGKSKEMFLLFQSWYNPMNNIEQAIRSWNGGLHYSVKRTQRYFDKVMSLMK